MEGAEHDEKNEKSNDCICNYNHNTNLINYSALRIPFISTPT